VWTFGLVIYIGIFFVKYIFIDNYEPTKSTTIAALVCVAFILVLIVHWNIWGSYILVP